MSLVRFASKEEIVIGRSQAPKGGEAAACELPALRARSSEFYDRSVLAGVLFVLSPRWPPYPFFIAGRRRLAVQAD